MKIKFICLFFACLFLTSCATKKMSPAGSVIKSPVAKTTITKIEKIVSVAKQQIGRPYRYGGDNPKGFDCSGLVQYVYASAGLNFPRISKDQAKKGKRIFPMQETQKGDLLFFGRGYFVTHVGIVIGMSHGYPVMVHSSSKRGIIQTSLVNSRYWKKRFLYARRIL